MPAPLNMQPLAERAAAMVPDGSVIGLGTGKAAKQFIDCLGVRVKAGLVVRGVPTSNASADQARSLGIPLATLDEVETLDLDFDGADEVAPNGDLIKGYGGALLREKVVAAASKHFVVLVGEEKLVPRLGNHGKLPVEVVVFAEAFCRRRLAALGLRPVTRSTADGKPYLTDNGNLILDCGLDEQADPRGLEAKIMRVPGVVDTGLFLGMAGTVLVQRPDRVDEIRVA